MRQSRTPLALAFFIALSGACGGSDDEGTPAEYENVPGPNVPLPPEPRRTTAEGEVTITPDAGAVVSVELSDRVGGSTVYSGKQSGFSLEMQCGDNVADVHVELYFDRGGSEILRIERTADRWTVNGRVAEIVPSRPASADAGTVDAGDSGDAGEAGVDAGAADPSTVDLVNGVGFPQIDHSRIVFVTLVANEIRYDIRATIPWRTSTAPTTCSVQKPGTGTKSSSSGGCGSGSSSRRSSGGDWD